MNSQTAQFYNIPTEKQVQENRDLVLSAISRSRSDAIANREQDEDTFCVFVANYCSDQGNNDRDSFDLLKQIGVYIEDNQDQDYCEMAQQHLAGYARRLTRWLRIRGVMFDVRWQDSSLDLIAICELWVGLVPDNWQFVDGDADWYHYGGIWRNMLDPDNYDLLKACPLSEYDSGADPEQVVVSRASFRCADIADYRSDPALVKFAELSADSPAIHVAVVAMEYGYNTETEIERSWETVF